MQNSSTVDAISLSHSFDSLSMDEDFMNFLLDGSAAPQLPASMKTDDNQDLHLAAQPTAAMVSDDQFAFNNMSEGETTQDNQAAERPSLPPQPSNTTTAISSAATQLPTTLSLPPPPPTPPSDGLSLSSPGLDDPFAGLTDIFPILGDLAEPVIEKEEEIESGSVQTTSSTTTTTTTAAAAVAVPLVKVKEEPKEPKRKSSSSSKEKKAARAAKKQKLEPQPSDFIESLRGMNSAQLEQYAETQPLTEAQQTELKEWIRKIKNRESASLSRQNRKNHQQELEIQIEGLDTSNSRLREQITELQIENRVLKKELDDFKTLIEKSNLGQAFALYNNTKKATPSAPVTAPVAAEAQPSATPSAVVPSAPLASSAPAPTPAVVPSGGIQLSDVILKAMSGGKPNKEGMALVLYLLMALHSYGQYWNKVTAQHQVAMPQPDEVTVQA